MRARIFGLALLIALGSAVRASAAVVTASWNPATTNTNGSSLTNLAGYRIFESTNSLLTATTQQAMIDPLVLKFAVAPSLASFAITLAGGTTYYFRATAYNSAGAQSAFNVNGSNQGVEVSTYIASAATTTITLPLNNAFYNSLANIAGGSYSSVGMSTVALSIQDANLPAPSNCFNAGSNAFSATCPSWFPAQGAACGGTSCNWSYSGIAWSNGHTYIVVSQAVNVAGTPQSTFTVGVSSNAFTFDTQAPTAGIALPVSGNAYSSLATISGTSVDNVGVSTVALSVQDLTANSCYSPGSGFGAACPSFFPAQGAACNGTSCSWSYSAIAWASGHQYVVVSQATDLAGNSQSTYAVGVSSSAFTFDTQPPTISITAPANNAKVFGTIQISGTATDNVAVSSVQFYIDGAVLGPPRNAAPYALSWNANSVSDGAHTLSAVAWDAAGNASTPALAGILVYSTHTYIGLAWDPTVASQAIVRIESSDSTFPNSLSLQGVVVTLPSGPHTLDLTRLSTAPLVYAYKGPVSQFASRDFFSLSGTTQTVTSGPQVFPALGQGIEIDPALGGEALEATGPAAVIIAVGGVTQAAQIAINPELPDPLGQRSTAMNRQNLRGLGAGRDIVFTSSGTLNAATLILPFDPTQIPAGRSSADVRVGYFDYASGSWQVVDNATVIGSLVQASVTHFSNYAPLLLMPQSAPGLLQAYVYPNPAVGSQEPTIRAELGVVDHVDVSIYNAAGRLVHSDTLSGPPTGIANGNYYYDYTWNGAKASGGYYVVIHGHAGDGTLVKARAKFAVIK